MFYIIISILSLVLMFFTGFIIGKKKEYIKEPFGLSIVHKNKNIERDYFMENYEVTSINDILEDLSKEYEKDFIHHSQ